MLRIDYTRYWYHKHWLSFCLLPLAGIFQIISGVRKWLYRIGVFKSYQLPVPIIVVGNITVGGTGKTPFVIWLATLLKEHGFSPGIVSRGVGGPPKAIPHWVQMSDTALEVGDEARMILRNTQCPFVIGVDRVAAAKMLLEQGVCNIIISDDGLQHYRMARDVEVVILDGKRLFGNGFVLPAGPLRETRNRLAEADFVIGNGQTAECEFSFNLEPDSLINCQDAARVIQCHSLTSKKVHAVAGIGNPDRFFQSLRSIGYEVIPHVYPDHYLYQGSEFIFDDDLPVLMTEKDAVKCSQFAMEKMWYLKVKLVPDLSLPKALMTKINEMENDYAKLNTENDPVGSNIKFDTD